MEPRIIIHGGIESLIDTDEIIEKQKFLESICRVSYEFLRENSALDAVEYAIKMLEDNPLFNAGTGAILQSDAVQRMDAAIMDGYNSKAGAVAQIRGVKNPIEVARLVMEKSPPCLISGEEAQKFAYENGIKRYNNTVTRESFEKWFKVRDEIPHGTVGAVAIDEYGHIAAGTSTGGRATSYPGRVGDVPIIGAGTYADEYAGISCTGHGEKIMLVGLAHLVAFNAANGLNLKEAAEKSLEKLKKINGVGGFIAIGYQGDIEHKATEGAYMPVAFIPK